MLNKKLILLVVAACGLQANLFGSVLSDVALRGFPENLADAETFKRQFDGYAQAHGKVKVNPYQEALDKSCNKVGKPGRYLNDVSGDFKSRAFAACGELIKDKHPKAYAAIAPKSGSAVANPFEELGLKASDKAYAKYTDKEIEDAYLLLSRVAQEQKDEARERRVKDAYVILSDKNKRAAFLESEVEFEVE